MGITEAVRGFLAQVPASVTVVAATKGRTADEVSEAVDAGIRVVGENYVQEASAKRKAVRVGVSWHCIGHLQRNKVRQALEVFDMIQTIDSLRLAEAVSKEAGRRQRTVPVLIEVNSGRESSKAGVAPEDAEEFLRAVCRLPHLRVEGLMTMGPLVERPEDIRPYFALTRRLFDSLAGLGLPNTQMRILSMGMSDSWEIAVEEGATMIRIGTALFGPRPTQGRRSE